MKKKKGKKGKEKGSGGEGLPEAFQRRVKDA